MGEPIDIAAAREARQPQPGSQHVRVVDGVKWFEFLCEYEAHDGSYSFSLWALDQSDAMRRMIALKGTARVKGQVFEETPA